MVFGVVEYSFNLIRKQPKILLPQVLNWVSSVIILAFFYFAFLDLLPVFSQPSAAIIKEIINVISRYAAPFVTFIVIAFLIDIFVQAVYPGIVKQAFSRKIIMLVDAFSQAGKRFLSLLWTYIVLILLGIGIALMFIIIFFVLARLSPILSIILFIIILIAGIIYIVPGLFMLSTVIVLENKSGIQAIKRSFQLSKGRIISIWIVLILLAIFSFALGILGYIPFIGILLTLPIYAFVHTWFMNAAPTFYFMIEKKAKPKI